MSGPKFEASVDDVEGDAAEEEVGRAEGRQVHLLEVRVPHAVGAQLLQSGVQDNINVGYYLANEVRVGHVLCRSGCSPVRPRKAPGES